MGGWVCLCVLDIADFEVMGVGVNGHRHTLLGKYVMDIFGLDKTAGGLKSLVAGELCAGTRARARVCAYVHVCVCVCRWVRGPCARTFERVI